MILKIQNLHKIYPNNTHALKGVSFEVADGEFLVVIGLSGAGKSTLLRCINRLIEPTAGSIEFMGREMTALSKDELREARCNIGMVFQQFNLVKRRTVLENVMSGKLGLIPTLQSITGRYPAAILDEAHRCMQAVSIEEKADTRADSLSGGQQQRVAIARSLMQHPKLLLADEPVASLDPATANSVMQYFELMNKEYGTTVICNLHFLSLVRKYAGRVIALKEGNIVYEGLPGEINEAWFKTIYGSDAEEVEIR